MQQYILYTDGGARGNPGPAAAGVVVYNAKGKELDRFSSFLGHATNNQAEYQALILGLGRIAKLIGNEHRQAETAVKSFLDSELLVRQLNGEYRIKNKDLKPLFVRLQELAGKFDRVIFKHIPREQNKLADKLVNTELDRHC